MIIEETKIILVAGFWRAWIVFPLVLLNYKTKGKIGFTKGLFGDSLFIMYLTARLVFFQKNAEEVARKILER